MTSKNGKQNFKNVYFTNFSVIIRDTDEIQSMTRLTLLQWMTLKRDLR